MTVRWRGARRSYARASMLPRCEILPHVAALFCVLARFIWQLVFVMRFLRYDFGIPSVAATDAALIAPRDDLGRSSSRAGRGKSLPDGALVGESWETAVESVVCNAPYTGMTLGEMTARLGESLLGHRAVAMFGQRFPLLAKFIDARQWLSVQVHPDDVYAAAHEHGKLGKTEMWYILHAEAGAQVVYGLKREASRDEVRAAIQRNRLEDLLHMAEVTAGDVIFVPAGTVHAIGGGITLYELQEYSDVTYRLYDYGRLQANGQPRELHIDASLEVMRMVPRHWGCRLLCRRWRLPLVGGGGFWRAAATFSKS